MGDLQRDSTNTMVNKFKTLADHHRKLPILEAWLEKKSSSMGRRYQKRWVIFSK